ncbi:hypothetical protein pb186bvf_018312 [Paramecium bursaria]
MYNRKFEQLISQIKDYQYQPERPRTQQQRRPVMPEIQRKITYDPSLSLIDRLYPRQYTDPKMNFVKKRERALRSTQSAQGRRRREDTSDLEPLQLTYNDYTQEAPKEQPKKKIITQQTSQNDYYQKTLFMLKTMQQDNKRLFKVHL